MKGKRALITFNYMNWIVCYISICILNLKKAFVNENGLWLSDNSENQIISFLQIRFSGDKTLCWACCLLHNFLQPARGLLSRSYPKFAHNSKHAPNLAVIQHQQYNYRQFNITAAYRVKAPITSIQELNRKTNN